MRRSLYTAVERRRQTYLDVSLPQNMPTISVEG
jgi:hypothetical protein